MTTNLLTLIATSRLPMVFHRPEEIDQVRILQAAGLVIAIVPAPSDPLVMGGVPTAAQVLAMTEKGRYEAESLGACRENPAMTRWKNILPAIKAKITGRNSENGPTDRTG